MSEGPSGGESRNVTRRRFIGMGLLGAAPILIPGAALAGMHVRASKHVQKAATRALSFYNLHTGESLKTVYWEHGQYVSGALDEINYLLRDYRRDEVKPIDPNLLDLLVALRDRIHSKAHYEVISGYRSPATNAMLHAETEGVSAHSLHVDGRAIDIRIPGRSLGLVRVAALSMQRGGVGYYPGRFVHVDTGRVRWW
ncbi:MAG: DUF882 domain-containing protein [Candidatus Binataceae bacterium]